MILYRPIGKSELELVKKSGWRRWPPRLADQPIFYPVQEAGSWDLKELWVPAEELPTYNDGSVGTIQVEAVYRDGRRLGKDKYTIWNSRSW